MLKVPKDEFRFRTVRASFNEVNQAVQEKELLNNDALSEYNREIPRAAGEATRSIEAAEGYAIERVKAAAGVASRLVALYAEYAKAPEVTRRQLYFETLTDVLPRVGHTLVIDESLKSPLMLLNLSPGGRRQLRMRVVAIACSTPFSADLLHHRGKVTHV